MAPPAPSAPRSASAPRLRPITRDDHADVLALNDRHVELTSPLDADRLAQMCAVADRAAVIDLDGRFAGFVLTYAHGAAYDGENFAWFAQHFDDYCYLDRIVVHEDFRRRGVAAQVYDELERGCGRPVLTLEVNLDPPNQPSLEFHRRRGYVEVGQRVSAGHLVVMLARALGSP